jgi:hypothetical protein
MSLVTAGVRIIVSEPFELSKPNLFGIIKSRRGESLFVELSDPITLKGFTSKHMEFRPRFKEESISMLEKNQAISVNGALLVEGQKDPVFALIAALSVD